MVARQGSKGSSIRVIEGQDPGRGRERLGAVEMKLFPGVGRWRGKPTTREQKEEEKRGRVKEGKRRKSRGQKSKKYFQTFRLSESTQYSCIISYLTRVPGPRDGNFQL
jgi:hypothetical protein